MALRDIKVGVTAESNPDRTFLVPEEKLRFDSENPRFVDFAGKGEGEILQFLYDEADLNELVQSISASGYIDYEPLLVVKENDGYVVLEGNRRVGAVRLLRSPALQAELKAQLPQLSPALNRSTWTTSGRCWHGSTAPREPILRPSFSPRTPISTA